ncbi:2Fe-2S iron-sulfur cluster-binding protein [Marinomonas posidonica]|uniref:Ferredoxin n=1 Tax=Marinomonas posidonica (strain CECT 7376 / NCIMB 14433 / IVIA-Po-181) TaxID=491952 RepID=F6CZC8_MARPP|nr:2Fe-2S iron-sulfur cluster binding domain-containing protein [Marinomonas posidonica]AEF54665.1 ferredoxin [Marinomonas posidonica IVIA-Po-181]
MSSQGLTISLNGKKVRAAFGENLLSALLANQCDVHYGCRAGACGACRLYDQNNGESLLACQTQLVSPMSLTTQPVSSNIPFALISKKWLDEASIELTLMGPSDESFGDRLRLAFDQDGLTEEFMALNAAGQALTLVLSKPHLSTTDWQQALNLTPADRVFLQLQQGVRKGRLLYELGVDHGSWLVILAAENAAYEGHWREVLANVDCHLLACCTLSDESEGLAEQTDLKEAFAHVLSKTNSTDLNILYHGQKRSLQQWDTYLRPLRIRTRQLHFVR